MWRTLSNEAREAIGRMCEQHGGHLYDYCRTALSASDAELAVAGALLSAHVHADRLRDRDLLRPWLYALARCHRAAVAATRPTSAGTWTRPGAPDLVPDALQALDAPHRELLDLSVRHELASAEIAAIFDVAAIQVNTMIAEAADRFEEWVAAVRAARTRDGCPRLAVRVTDWTKTPGRRTRTRIGRHIRSCPACRAAPRELRAGVLLLDLPPAAVPDTLRDQPAWGDPLPSDPAAWRPDGFPAQARDLMEPPPALISLVPGPTTETRENPWPAAGAAAAGQEPSEPPERPRRGPSAPPGTAEALLRAAHQTGERLVPTGTTGPSAPPAGQDSSGDTIPYRKRGDFPPMRVPPRPSSPPARSAPPHWGAGDQADDEVRDPAPSPSRRDAGGQRATGGRVPPSRWGTSGREDPRTSAPTGEPSDRTPPPRTEAEPPSPLDPHPAEDPVTRPVEDLVTRPAEDPRKAPLPHHRAEDPREASLPRPADDPREARLPHPVEDSRPAARNHTPPFRVEHERAATRNHSPSHPTETPSSPWTATDAMGRAVDAASAGSGDPSSSSASRRSGTPPDLTPPSPAAGREVSRDHPTERKRGTTPGSAGKRDHIPPHGSEHGRDAPPDLREAGDRTPPHVAGRGRDAMSGSGYGGWSEGDGRTAPHPGEPDWRITVPLPRRSDDPPRPHAPLRSLDPGWRSGRTPVTQYGDKLVFAAPRDGSAGGETWDEFWRDRPDEDDPEARISLQWLVRVALIVGVVMLVAGLTWAGIQSRQRQVPAGPGTGQAPTGQGPSDPGATQATDPDATQPHPDATQATDPDATQPRPDASQATDPDATQAPGDPWASPAPAVTGADGNGRRPALGQKALPAPPVAAISPASVRLGERRTGTFRLTCTGDCRVTSFSGSNGIDVSGNGFTVRAPAARPGCAGPPVTESGVVTVHWTGTASGDGETTEGTEGTVSTDGTLTMMVSWTVASDRGALIPDRNGGGYWSNCPQSRE